MRIVVLSVIACLACTAALADGAVGKIITLTDRQKLARYEATRTKALGEARAGDASDIATLDHLASAAPLPFPGLDLTGEWRCRTIKAGGLADLVVYGWFKCRVTDDGSGWQLEKLTGSQRTIGRFYDDGESRLIYLGSQFIAGDAPKPYGSGPETDQVGYAFRTGPKSWRIELPEPYYESTLDLLELVR